MPKARPAPEPVAPAERRGESPDARKEYGRRLRTARQAAGYDTIHEAAAVAGLPLSQLTNWENGRRSPSLASIDHLVQSLGLDPATILAGPDHVTPEPPRRLAPYRNPNVR